MTFDQQRLVRLQRLLGDRYRFEAFIGRGATATVFAVHNPRLDRAEALKVLNERHEEEFSDRFTHEAKIAAALDHPAIVKIFDYGEIQGVFWYAMQFIQGPTLLQYIRKNGPMAQLEAARIIVHLLDALDYSHRRGVIHRDIKPANLILDQEGHPYIADFGIAKAADSMLKTQTGLVLGTPAYVAPEQARGEELDGRADLYALGITLYEMLTGTYPFPGQSSLQTLVERLSADPEPISSKIPDIDPRLDDIVMRVLQRDKNDRFSGAAEMRDELVRFSGDAEIMLAHPIEIPECKPLEASDFSSEPSSPSAALTTLSPDRPKRSWSIRRMAVASLVIVGTLGVTGYFAGSRPLGPAQPAESSAVEGTEDQLAAHSPPSAEAERESRNNGPDEGVFEPEVPTVPPEPTPTVAPRAPTPTPEPIARRPVQAPRLLEGSSPVLSPDLLAECGGKTVHLSLLVGADGSVRDARVLRSVSDQCEQAAVAAGLKYSFQPALAADGHPVDARTSVSIEFVEVEQ